MPTADGGPRLAVDPTHFRRSAHGFRQAEARAVWRAVQAPVLTVDGGISPACRWVDDRERKTRRACFANMTHIELADLGHILHWPAPARMADALRGFLTTA